jgi:hypothetical protein
MEPASNVAKWTYWFVDTIPSSYDWVHIVGPAPWLPWLSLTEVAVPPGRSRPVGFYDIPEIPPVSLNLSVEGLFEFIVVARSGILRHGPGLGQYYRERYPTLRSWIEYFILEHDLQVSLPCE